jgi:hypothetical protein
MLALLLALAASACAAASPFSRYYGTKPNVIILFADDYGWGDVGHNNPEVKETVAIDGLAASGMTFKNMHTFPLCTPSRAQLLTGRLGPRTGVTTNFATTSTHGLPRTEYTIAELLRPAGYDTAMLGKWRALRASLLHISFVCALAYASARGLHPSLNSFLHLTSPPMHPLRRSGYASWLPPLLQGLSERS